MAAAAWTREGVPCVARNVKTSVVVLRETENSPRQGHTRCRSSGMGPGGERQNMNAGEERSEAVLSGYAYYCAGMLLYSRVVNPACEGNRPTGTGKGRRNAVKEQQRVLRWFTLSLPMHELRHGHTHAKTFKTP